MPEATFLCWVRDKPGKRRHPHNNISRRPAVPQWAPSRRTPPSTCAHGVADYIGDTSPLAARSHRRRRPCCLPVYPWMGFGTWRVLQVLQGPSGTLFFRGILTSPHLGGQAPRFERISKHMQQAQNIQRPLSHCNKFIHLQSITWGPHQGSLYHNPLA